MAVVLVFAIGLLAGSTSVKGTRVSLRAGEMGAPDSASALVETSEGCSLETLEAAQQALRSGLVPALNNIKGMQKVGNTWTVEHLLTVSRHAFDNACTAAMERKCADLGKHCVNYDGPHGYQTTGQCVECGKFGAPECGSLLETEAGWAKVATQESSPSVGCPTSLSTAEAYLVDLVPSLKKKLSGFDQVDNTWSIKKLLAHANSLLADDTCNNPVNQEECDSPDQVCVTVDGPRGPLTSHTCMECGEWGNPIC